MSLIDGDIRKIGCIEIPDRIFLYAQDGFLLLVKPRWKILIEPLQIVYSRLGVDLLSIGGDERRMDLLSSSDLMVVFFYERAFQFRHLNGNEIYI